ncbi:MAG TPA: G8 domain-containing protein, partial [Gemmataceae bacterium]|nr:G8 domain-containing protein [Gemmataceae bacterium]
MKRLSLVLAMLLSLASRGACDDAPVIKSARSGPWSAPSTWEGGKVPAAGARVLIRPRHRIVYDVKSEDVIRGVNVAGTLAFAADRDTRLDVGLIKVQPTDEYDESGFDCTAHIELTEKEVTLPALEVGTAERPIDARHTALIRLTYIAGMDKESCPAIVCCGGRMDFHGAPMNRTWVRLGATAAPMAKEITLAEKVTGWKVGDRIILTSTNVEYARKKQPTEERIIAGIDGAKIQLDAPLDNEHLGAGDYRGEVANLSRNVIVESADLAMRGHTMYHKHSAGSIAYAEFRHLGKKGVLGRYALHFHLCGDTMRGSSVVGASIWDSDNRWLTIHGTNYLVVRDCVGYKSLGHGYFFEDGTEVFNVLDRNLAVAARRTKRLPKQVLPFDANDGAGFWWANSRNTFTRNVAAECGQYGFRFEATKGSSFDTNLRVEQPDGSF